MPKMYELLVYELSDGKWRVRVRYTMNGKQETFWTFPSHHRWDAVMAAMDATVSACFQRAGSNGN